MKNYNVYAIVYLGEYEAKRKVDLENDPEIIRMAKKMFPDIEIHIEAHMKRERNKKLDPSLFVYNLDEFLDGE